MWRLEICKNFIIKYKIIGYPFEFRLKYCTLINIGCNYFNLAAHLLHSNLIQCAVNTPTALHLFSIRYTPLTMWTHTHKRTLCSSSEQSLPCESNASWYGITSDPNCSRMSTDYLNNVNYHNSSDKFATLKTWYYTLGLEFSRNVPHYNFKPWLN